MGLLANPTDWHYSGDPAASTLDLIRYLVQDVDADVPLLTDTELNYEIAHWTPLVSTPYEIAAEVCERIAAKFAGVTQISADGVSVDLSDVTGKYAGLAKSLRAQAEREVASDTIDMAALGVCQSWDPSIKPLSTGVGFQDNPLAGNQQYGGQEAAVPPDRDDLETYFGE